MTIHDIIIRQIKNNNLNGNNYDFVIGGLCVLNNKPYAEIKGVVDDLIESGELGLNSNNEIIITTLGEYGNFGVKPSKRNQKRENNLLEGKIQGTRGNFAFFIPFNGDDDIYVHADNLNGALNGDTVAVEVYKTKRGKEARVVKIIERGNNKIVGKITINTNNAFVVCDDVKLGKDIYVPLSKLNGAKNGDKVVVKINRYKDGKNPEGEVVEVLGKPNEIETEVLSIIRSNNLYEVFPNDVLESANKIAQEVKLENYKGRLDLTKELIFTIDGEDAKDLDDAISLTYDQKGQRVLGVHIADVGEYVKQNSIIDNEAFKRGTSVYFPNFVVPMLPKSLSNGICSLNELVNRLTLSVFITYNAKAEVVDYKIYESVIKSKKRFTYTEVDKILTGDKDALERNHTFSETLIEMNKLAKQLAILREKRGAIDFDIPEVKFELSPTGDVLEVKTRERNDSHKLIESFMIAANEVIAEHFLKQKMPFVYRIHEKPELDKINNFFGFIKQFGLKPTKSSENIAPKDLQAILKQISDSDIKYVVNKVCLRSLKKAKYSPECHGHFGLASTYYCHFTSPIRRYPDLTIHRIIKDYLRGNLNGRKIADLKHFVASSSQVSSEREMIAERVERDVDDLYKVYYMRNHLGEEFEGRISSVTPYGAYVELDNTVEGLVRLEDLPADQYKYDEIEHSLSGIKNKVKIGQKVKVKAVRADILAREIDFILA